MKIIDMTAVAASARRMGPQAMRQAPPTLMPALPSGFRQLGMSVHRDFAQIAKNGFALTVDGAFYSDASKTQFPNLQPNLGSSGNSYSWSMAWYEDSLWIGTNRDVTSQSFTDRDPAEIWRYTPSSFDETGDWGLSGTWTRVFASPSIRPLYAGITRGQIPFDLPRDIGYRSMAWSLGGIIGPPIFGAILDLSGSYSVAWLALAMIVGTGFLIFVFKFKEARR